VEFLIPSCSDILFNNVLYGVKPVVKRYSKYERRIMFAVTPNGSMIKPRCIFLLFNNHAGYLSIIVEQQ
jgi:hypothetical protein